MKFLPAQLSIFFVPRLGFYSCDFCAFSRLNFFPLSRFTIHDSRFTFPLCFDRLLVPPKIGNRPSAIGNTWRLSVSICVHLWLAFHFDLSTASALKNWQLKIGNWQCAEVSA